MKHAHWAHMGVCVAVMLVAVLLPTYLANKQTEKTNLQKVDSPVPAQERRTGEEKSVTNGDMTMTVAPDLLAAGNTDSFVVTLNTHSVELSMDMVKSVILLLPDGRTFAPIRWDGDPVGGHHRTGKLFFAQEVAPKDGLTLVLRDGGNEWKIVWE